MEPAFAGQQPSAQFLGGVPTRVRADAHSKGPHLQQGPNRPQTKLAMTAVDIMPTVNAKVSKKIASPLQVDGPFLANVTKDSKFVANCFQIKPIPILLVHH
ncbi:hypothetical protein BC940DRAFT_292164 [Gongronella butleri]|nr:hypothetical protein BC940DRAFT_292164 [Gongronella butleri]